MGRNVAWGEMSRGETSRGEMSRGEMSFGEKRRIAHLETMNFDIYAFLLFVKAENDQKSKFRVSNQ